MTPERWAQIEELFHRAAEREAEPRRVLLDEACPNDPELRREVEELLSCEVGARDHLQAAVHSELETLGCRLTGETISHYRILEAIGSGGMGMVYRAEDIMLARPVALKFLTEDSAKDPVALRRFEREARSASALEHPNICPIYEFGQHDGRPFLVMQLLEGQTLRELISSNRPEKTPFELSKLFDLAIQIVSGLEAAHKKSIIHRDIKPANIFVTSQGQAKILDFGLAKVSRAVTATADESESDPRDQDAAVGAPHETVAQTASDSFLSRTGVAMGTAGYMSPEQVRGEKLDARTDVFSFGLVLYEMATGQRAFPGDTGPVLREAILKRIPSPARHLNHELPMKFERIIQRALEKDREARYQTADEMRADLETLQRDMVSRHVALWATLATVGAVLLIAGAIFWFSKRQLPSVAALPDLKVQQLTINSAENRVTSGAISPDGKHLAYVDTKGMHIKRIETGATQTVPNPEELRNESVDWEITPNTWFPDSTRFLAQAHPASEDGVWSSQTTSIWVASVLGGEPRRLRENATAWSVSPDGSMVAFGTNRGRVGDREIWLMRPNGEQARKLYETGQDSSIGGLIWTADGQRAIYLSSKAGDDGGHDTLVSRDVRGGPITTLISPSDMSKMDDASWLPDGRLVYSVRETQTVGDTCNYWIRRIDARTGELLEKPTRLTNWVGFCMNYTGATADGKRVVFLESSNRGTVYVGNLAAGGNQILNPRHFTLDESSDVLQDWTADSKTIIFTSNRAGTFGIYKQSLNEDSPESVYTGAVGFGQTRVSPDGRWLVALHWHNPGNFSGPAQVMRIPIAGGLPELVFSTLSSYISCARPPSSLCVVAEPTEGRKQAVVSVFDPVKGRGPELARFDLEPNSDDSWLCEISPDGKRLAIALSVEGPIEILPLTGHAGQVIHVKGLHNIATLNWAADGKGLFVSSGFKGGSVVLHVDLHGRTNVLWENNRSGENNGRPSPDGRQLAIQVWRTNSNMWMMENF